MMGSSSADDGVSSQPLTASTVLPFSSCFVISITASHPVDPLPRDQNTLSLYVSIALLCKSCNHLDPSLAKKTAKPARRVPKKRSCAAVWPSQDLFQRCAPLRRPVFLRPGYPAGPSDHFLTMRSRLLPLRYSYSIWSIVFLTM